MTPTISRLTTLSLLVCVACSGGAPTTDDPIDAGAPTTDAAIPGIVTDAGTVDAGTPVFVDAGDPAERAPRRWPDETALTHDVDRSIAAVLERDRTAGACARYTAGATDRETLVLCDSGGRSPTPR